MTRVFPQIAAGILALGLVMVPYVGVTAQTTQQAVHLQAGDSLTWDCATNASVTFGSTSGSVQCAASATATSTPVSPTATVPPTPAPTATPTAANINGVPLCTDHDVTKWHPLVKRDASGNVTCTYGHEHGMDPSRGDAVFGPLNVPGGQQISYPWETPNENQIVNKHRVYKWMVVTNLPCDTRTPQGDLQDITAFRYEVHNDGNLGAAVRFHSYWIEAELTNCATGEKGYASFGGHNDFAVLRVGDTIVPLPGVDPPASCILNGDARDEHDIHETTIPGGGSVWYGANNRGTTGPGCDDEDVPDPVVGFQTNIGTDGWGPVDPASPSTIHLWADHSQHHGTVTGTDDVTISVSPLQADATGHVTASGFLDRHGRVVQGCSTITTDCVPYVFRNVPGTRAFITHKNPVGYDGDVLGPHGEPGFYVSEPIH